MYRQYYYARSRSNVASPSATIQDAFHAPPLSRAYTTSAIDSAPDYATSNVTGHRGNLEVEGLPDHRYFTAQRPKRSRSHRHPDRGCRPVEVDRYSEVHQYSSADGRQDGALIGYDPARGGCAPCWSRGDDIILPSDSISQISTHGSSSSASSSNSDRSRRRPRYGDSDRGPSSQTSRSYRDDLSSIYEGPEVYDKEGGYYKVERRPCLSRG